MQKFVLYLFAFLLLSGIAIFGYGKYTNSAPWKEWLGLETYKETSPFQTIVREEYYKEHAYENCELNPYQDEGFDTRKQCEKTFDCIAKAFASIVPDADMQELASDMKTSGGESAALGYLSTKKTLEEQFNVKKQRCLP